MKIRQVPSDDFWPVFKKLQATVFKTQTYDIHALMTDHEKKGFEARKKFTTERIKIFFGLFDEKDRMIGWSVSFQTQPNELYMMSSAVLPKYRRKGWYTKLVEATLKEAQKLGFQVVTSNHHATNNPVIIAKLKMGFVIAGLEISDNMGILLKLMYSFHPLRASVMKYRTGEEHPSKQVRKVLRLK